MTDDKGEPTLVDVMVEQLRQVEQERLRRKLTEGWVTLEDGRHIFIGPAGHAVSGRYYRGSIDGKYQQNSYFTKEPREADVYAQTYGGQVSEHEIEAKNALEANDIWDAGKKLGISFDRDTDNPTVVRPRILDAARKSGYDAIDMGNWIVAIDPNIVKQTTS